MEIMMAHKQKKKPKKPRTSTGISKEAAEEFGRAFKPKKPKKKK